MWVAFAAMQKLPYKAEYNPQLSTNRTLIFRPKFGEKNEVDRIKRTQKSSGKHTLPNHFIESK